MPWVGELRDLPHGLVVECVTASALNAAIRAGKAADTDVERERLRVAEGAPDNAGTDLKHAAKGLLALYKLQTSVVNAFSSTKAAVLNGNAVLIRGEYGSLPLVYRFQTAAAFSHCILVTPSHVSGNGFVVDPLDARGPDARPLGRDIPWKFIQAYCDSDQDNALIVQWAPAVPAPAPKPAPAPVPAGPTAAQKAAAHVAAVAHAAHLAVLHALHVLHIKNKG
jgi:hypothetical protein